jgi:hypothetical protein
MSDSRTDFDSNSNHGNVPRETSFGQRGSETFQGNPYSGDLTGAPSPGGVLRSGPPGRTAPGIPSCEPLPSSHPPADLPGLGQPASRDDGAPSPGGNSE